MAFKKYAVEDNCTAKLATAIDKTSTKIKLKEAVNLPTQGEWIATLVKKQGEEILKMEKVLVLKRELDVLTVQRGFQSKAQDWDENDQINLYITAEIVREIQNAIESKADLVDGKVPASQLPEIDESNLVHKSGEEEITGRKKFKDCLAMIGTNGQYWRGETLQLRKGAGEERRVMNGRTDYDGGLLFEYLNDGYLNNFLIRRKGGLQWGYFTDNPNDKRWFKIGTRSDLSGINHDQGGNQLQVLWGDLQPQGTGHDGGWGLMFGPDQNPYLSMQNATTRIGRTDGEVEIKSPKIYLHDGTDILGDRKTRTPTDAYQISSIESSNCKYLVIGKTMFVMGVVVFKSGNSQEVAITLPHSVLDSGCAVELRGPGGFQFTRGYGQAVGNTLWFHAGDNNMPTNQNVALRFNAVLYLQ